MKDIPAQKLQAQRKRAHFLGIRFLEANSPPVLLKDIFPPKSSLVPHLTISLQNENGNKQLKDLSLIDCKSKEIGSQDQMERLTISVLVNSKHTLLLQREPREVH